MATPLATLHSLSAASHGVALFLGNFDTNGSSNPADVDGVGYSVARTATGKYTVTINHLATDAVYLHVGRTEGTAGTFVVSSTMLDPATRAFVITTAAPATPGTAADIAAGTNNRIHFALALRTVKGAR